jgi:hypothetical protein
MGDNEFLDKDSIEELTKKERQKEEKERSKSSKAKSSKPNAFAQIMNGDFLTKEFVLNNLNFKYNAWWNKFVRKQ